VSTKLDKWAASGKVNRAILASGRFVRQKSKRDPAYLDLDDFLALRTTRRAFTAPVHITPLLQPSELLFCVSTPFKPSLARISAPRSLPADNNDRTLTFAVKFEDELRVIGLLSI